ncbi:MAG: threonine synthase [Planctomycetes bacterium]|nr:threonine synthase [Planctomycetota bacterium]
MILIGTRDARDTATFAQASSGATPAHGGLFTPRDWKRWNDIDDLLKLPWALRCAVILERLIGDEFERAVIDEIVREAFDFEAPLVRLADGSLVLELFHGPTLAFKDFGARFLAAVLTRIPSRGPRMILTATSGDTGAAVAHAFWRKIGVRVVVLYPRGRVSPLQERQIAALGENVSTFAVDGSFDDCQALVKTCFADRTLSADLGLTSANSINIARLLAQLLYYFEGAASARKSGVAGRLVVSVPSGNFGNLCAGLMAWKAGLPVHAFCAATNANDTVPRFLDGGAYEPRTSIATISNAMDVGAPSNWERIAGLFGHDLTAMRAQLRSEAVDDAATAAEIKRLNSIGYTACPHTAVASRVLRTQLAAGETGMFLATAHPAKFMEVLQPILGRTVEIPERLASMAQRPVLSESIDTNAAAFVTRLRALV